MHDNTPDVRQALDRDAARLIRFLASVAPAAGLAPSDIARLDQLAAATRR